MHHDHLFRRRPFVALVLLAFLLAGLCRGRTILHRQPAIAVQLRARDLRRFGHSRRRRLPGENYRHIWRSRELLLLCRGVRHGASGNVISAYEAQARALPTTGETYADVGIGGTEWFNVSQPTQLKMAARDRRI